MFPVSYKLGFYIPEEGILAATAVKTLNLTFLCLHLIDYGEITMAVQLI
jgi:hypothetical protein